MLSSVTVPIVVKTVPGFVILSLKSETVKDPGGPGGVRAEVLDPDQKLHVRGEDACGSGRERVGQRPSERRSDAESPGGRLTEFVVKSQGPRVGSRCEQAHAEDEAQRTSDRHSSIRPVTGWIGTVTYWISF
jgi:hypothetical protein